jgi:hypothetical protein
MADAVYYHAALYEFGEDARSEVMQRFHAQVQDISVKIQYDTDLDVRALFCRCGETC